MKFSDSKSIVLGDWRYRHAGLMAISAVGEGCYKQMETLLADIVNTVLPFLTDPHPRVRYAACNAVGQLSTDFAPGFQKKFHARVSIFFCYAFKEISIHLKHFCP